MKLLRGSRHLKELEKGAAVTIGNFDGVHIGHQALLAQLRQNALRLNLPTLVVFFEPQPGEYFSSSSAPAPARLMTRTEKIHYLAQFNIDYVYCLTFNETLALMSHDFFAECFIFSLFKAKYLLIGEDFRFGQSRLGTPTLLQHLGSSRDCMVETYQDFLTDGARVSSTQIRKALHEGDLKRAQQLLGRPYSMYGRVIHGAKRGRLWGIPTANVQIKHQNLPFTGVFLVQIKCKDEPNYWGVANLGRRPTVDGATCSLEVHLFDFNGSLYHEHIEVFFLERLRMEQKFSSVDALITQIHEDKDEARAMIAHIPSRSPLNYLNIE